VLIVNRPGADFATRARDVEEGRADLISVGTMALANPDLVARLQSGAALNEPDPSTFYGGDAKGYTDYPTL
jgi:N-ethylmaleimide reductase